MKYIYNVFILFFLLASCTPSLITRANEQNATDLIYEVNLNERADDTFWVNLFVNNLKTENAIYQFAASAPGTYRTMDIGRFVRSFKAFDESGNEILTEHISTNQWQISQPEKVVLIQYRIAETWDTPVDSNDVYVMCGSSLEEDHTLINGQAVFGYPSGMQNRSLKVKLLYPKDWFVGSALSKNEDGYYFAKDYGQIVDSPFLLGRLSRAEIDVKGTNVEVYVYSANDIIHAQEILKSVEDILEAAADFTNGLPVSRYTFLFHFENKKQFGAGAWEHNYSSIYAFNEAPIETMLQNGLPGTMAHEFFHIITPLQIHSELVENFDFVEPNPSAHLWLYEATTEWAAKIMQLRGELIDLETYLAQLKRKLFIADHFGQNFSLLDLSKKSFAKETQQEYPNIYHLGAMISGLLDIRLLELSDGKKGLREVLNELTKTYGPEKAFDENSFIETFSKITYPEISDFFELYIADINPLPLTDYFKKIGINYTAEFKTGLIDTTAGLGIKMKNEGLALDNLDSVVLGKGLKNGDKLLKLNGEEITMGNVRSLFSEINKLGLGESFEITVSRDGKALDFMLTKFTHEKVEKHFFEIIESPTEQQLALREAWIKNL